MGEFLQTKEGYELVRVASETGGKTTGIKNVATGEEVQVLPLNGWRGRNLAYTLFGERDAGMWSLGVSKLVKVKELKELPEWDGANTAHLQKFSGVVCVEVVCVNAGYGSYIEVTQMGVAADIRYWKQQEDMMAGRFTAMGIKIEPDILATTARGV